MKLFPAFSGNSFQSVGRHYINQISNYLFQLQILISDKGKDMFDYQEVIDRSMSLRECSCRRKFSHTHSLLKLKYIRNVNGVCR